MYKCESFKNEIFVKGQKAFKNLKFNLAETTKVWYHMKKLFQRKLYLILKTIENIVNQFKREEYKCCESLNMFSGKKFFRIENLKIVK